MASVHHQGYPLRNSLYWDETEYLNYYGMLSLHEVFEIVGSQLTETDIEVLSFLLNEAYSAPHPLNPAGWTVEPCEGDPDDMGVSPSPELLKAWRRLKPQAPQHALVVSHKPETGLELLLELERRGYLSDSNLEPLLQLLRVLTRHDLLPLVSHKKRRAGENDSKKFFLLDFESMLPLSCITCPNSPILMMTNLYFYAFQYPQREPDGGTQQRTETCSASLECDTAVGRQNFHILHSN